MIFDETAKKLYNSQNNCYSCGEEFSSEERGLVKVRDHCHCTGKCRRALHSKCNLRLRRNRTMPVFFATLRVMTVTCLLRDWPTHWVILIYITFNKSIHVDTTIKDEKEVEIYNVKGKNMFKHTSKYFKDDELNLIVRKGYILMSIFQTFLNLKRKKFLQKTSIIQC